MCFYTFLHLVFCETLRQKSSESMDLLAQGKIYYADLFSKTARSDPHLDPEKVVGRIVDLMRQSGRDSPDPF